MIREFCIAPIALAGILLATDIHLSKQSKNHTQVDNAGVIQVMTCETGLGLDLKASSNGFYGLDVQYGLTWKGNSLSVSFIPKLGLSATSHEVKELPQNIQFGLGAQVLLGYESYRLGLELWHMSNGSALGLNATDKPNIGLNLPLITIGRTF